MKKAFISGITGQDGAWLAKLLLEKGYQVFGGVRDKNKIDSWRLNHLGILNSVQFITFSLTNLEQIENTLKEIQPDEFYNLAAQSSVSESFQFPIETSLASGVGVLYILESIKNYSPQTKFFQASSSEIFGNTDDFPQTEDAIIQPTNPYAIAKAYSHFMTQYYRNTYNLFFVNGILYGHESELRSENFFTRKVSIHAANWYLGNKKILEVGNLETHKDWGYAREYVNGMYLSLQAEKGDDYIFATGKKIKIQEFINYSYSIIGVNLRWENQDQNLKGYDSKTNELIVKTNPEFYRPNQTKSAYGNISKAKQILNWEPKLDIREIAKIMVQNDINTLSHV